MFQQLNPRVPGNPNLTVPGQTMVADPNSGLLMPVYLVDGTMGRFEFDDFDLGLMGTGSTQPGGGSKTWKAVSGTGSVNEGITDTDGNHPGQIRFDVTALNDFATISGMRTGSSGSTKMLQLGNGPADIVWWVKSGGNLSDGTHRYFWEFGVGDTTGTGSPTNLVTAFYRDNVNGGAIVMHYVVGGSSSTINGSTVVAINTWYRFRLHFNKALNRVDLFTKVATGPEYPECTSSTTTPFTAASTLVSYGALSKSLGSGATRSVYVDRWQYGQTFSR